MKQTDFFSPGGGDSGSPMPDVSIEDALKKRVREIIKSCHRATQEELVTQVDAEVSLSTVQVLRRWEGEIENLSDAKNELLAEIGEILESFKSGKVSEFLQGEGSFRFPVCPWKKAASLVLGAIGLVTSVFEWVNLAAYRAATYDSFAIALSYCLPILLLPIAELVILHGGVFSEKFVKRFTVLQGLAGLVSGCAYLFFCFQQAGSSLDFLTQSGQATGLSSQDLCMWTQILTSLCFAAICFQGSLGMGITRPSKNPAYARAKKRIKSINRQIRQIEKAINEVKAACHRFEALKHRCVVFAQVQWGLVREAEEKYQHSVNTILNQNL